MAIAAHREVGADHERRDGPAKVTGSAPYAGDHPLADVVYAHPVQAGAARATITAFDTERAAAVPA
jgi:xanthine dehydrogenase YagR molybdenum-binding subunit